MPDMAFTLGAVAAGATVGGGVFAVADLSSRPSVVAVRLNRVLPIGGLRPWLDWLSDELERAGWHETPERMTALAAVLAASLATLGASSVLVASAGAAVVLGVLGGVGGLVLPLLALRSAIARKRGRLAAELVPVLELFMLELSGGGSAVSALGSVSVQVQGELASELRRMLIASQVAGTPTFEARLVEYSERTAIPAIGSLATILAASREYGTGVAQGVRALATDLRRAQRRELIAHSRRALNHVLLPTAVGVLLPFLAVLMYPAVIAMRRNLG